MNRKNTILVAVTINAALLVILFITALTTQEELISPSTQMAEAPPVQELDLQRPLFGDSADQTLRQPATPPSAPLADGQLLVKPIEPEPKKEAAPVLHVLPPAQNPPASPVAASAVVPPPAPSEPGLLEVVVKKGDTLEKIARAHRTTVDEIIKINHLPSSFLRVGQQLKVPAEKTVGAAAPKVKAPAVSENPEYYTVKVGDNPWTIAMKHHMKVEELLRLNALNEEKARKLKPGDRLRTR